MDLVQGTLGLVFVVGVALLVLLVGRELVCWYWKVNATLEQLVRLEQVLREISHKVERSNAGGASQTSGLSDS